MCDWINLGLKLHQVARDEVMGGGATAVDQHDVEIKTVAKLYQYRNDSNFIAVIKMQFKRNKLPFVKQVIFSCIIFRFLWTYIARFME